ncbi:LexA family protein [Burkholderia cenocepacia]|uniref:LexA family protein n=1 Tax=Burkholderia cenocepacia TaxID=95486 RepID=UPI001BA0BD45|nr:S24 family peptidase [Burkholderia cenocepacia]MBR8097679.1 LexA family transcriptional regulator [Burkholderia cenocepacia]MDI9683544.1 S24 family peptidase [Burkholderia cenocepacia]HEP6427759.1 LexA family transcriptional regulator [Burkholderia cenocepacia]
MNTLEDRIRTIVSETQAEQIELAAAAGVTKGTVNQWLDGKIKSIKLQYALGIQKRYGYNAVWIVTGDGEKKVAESPHRNVAPAQIGARRVPLISSVQAGRMTEAIDPFPPGGAFEFLLTDLDLSDHAFALEIEGLSMTPDFNPGDRVIVDPAIPPRPGDFVVAKNGREEATFKRYRVRGVDALGREAFELVPLNPDYPTINSETEPVRIIGVMVEHRRYRKR